MKPNSVFVLLGVALCLVDPIDPAGTFHNPILEGAVVGPYIYLHSDHYFYMPVTFNKGQLFVYKSQILSDWRLAERKLVYTAPAGFQEKLQESEIHFINGNWYIYFEMWEVNKTQTEMYVIEALNPKNPLGSYSKEIKLTWTIPEEETGRQDGTVLKYSDGRLYFIYEASQVNRTGLHLFVAPMSGPTAINGTRALIKGPGAAPAITSVQSAHTFTRGNRTHLLYTALSNGTYCLGLLGIDDGMDPLVTSSWSSLKDECVFEGNPEGSVWNPGYPSTVKSPDLSEDWIVYTACQENSTSIITIGTARIDRFKWNEGGTPTFSKPTGLTVAMPLPSGES